MMYEPEKSYFINANAGSGKTFNLVARVLNLLTSGVGYDKILCITYTRVGAMEMSERIYEILHRWSRGEFSDTGEDEQYGITQENRAFASRMLDEMIERDKKPQICTIESLYSRVLSMFEQEAGVRSGFKILFSEDKRKHAIVTECMLKLKGNKSIAEFYTDLISIGVISNLDSLKEILLWSLGKDRLSLERFFSSIDPQWEKSPDFSESLRGLYKDTLGAGESLDLTQTAEQLIVLSQKNFCNIFHPGHLEDIRTMLKDTGRYAKNCKYFKEFARICNDIRQQKSTPPSCRMVGQIIKDFSETIFTKSNSLEKRLETKSGGIRPCFIDPEKCPMSWIDEVYEHILEYNANLQLIKTIKGSLSIATVISEFLKIYNNKKLQLNTLDREDVSKRLLELFDCGGEYRDFALFKLDGGFDHILVDEAQDTNLDQWKVIWNLVEDMTSGVSARSSKKRGMFVVGDDKQAIFGFQGASPGIFSEVKSRLYSLFTESMEERGLGTSYRSSGEVIRFVNSVCRDPRVRRSLGQGGCVTHETVRENTPGAVSIVNCNISQPKGESSGHAKAYIIFQKITEALTEVTIQDKKTGAHRRPKPSEIMILAGQRDRELFSALFQMLGKAGLKLTFDAKKPYSQSLIILDIVALAKFCLLQKDEYSLCCVLKSPIFGFSEQQIQDLIFRRKEIDSTTGRDGLGIGVYDLLDKETREVISQFKNAAHRLCTTEFLRLALFLVMEKYPYQDILEASAMFDMAGECKALGDDSLEFFIQHFESNKSERFDSEPEMSGQSIRFSTVHSSKGLEAPVIFIVNASKDPARREGCKKLFEFASPEAERSSLPEMFYYLGSSKIEVIQDASIVNRITQARERHLRKSYEEYIRCLYVAITRARDVLYIFGDESKAKDLEDFADWFSVCRAAATVDDFPITTEEVVETYEQIEHNISKLLESRWSKLHPNAPHPQRDSKVIKSISLSNMKHGKAFADPRFDIPSTEKRAVVGGGIAATSAASVHKFRSGEWSQKRGVLIHKMLEIMGKSHGPLQSGEKYLTQVHGLTTSQAKNITNTALAVYEKFPDIFGNNALSEVSLLGLEGVDCSTEASRYSVVRAYRADKVVINEEENIIKIVDFKTSSSPHLKDTKEYREQLECYAGSIRRVYGEGFSIACYILWIESLECELFYQL